MRERRPITPRHPRELSCGLVAAIVIAISPVRWAGAEEAARDEVRLAEARERVAQGQRLGDEGDFGAALVEFLRARELLEGHPSQHVVDYNIGACYEGLFQYDRAIESYRRYLAGAGPAAPDRAAVEERIRTFEQRLGTIRLQVAATDFEVWVDNRLVGRGLTSIRVPAGRHTVQVRAPGHLQAQREVDLLERSEQVVALELERLVRLDAAYFWVSLGLAIVTAGAGAGVGGYALSEHRDLEETAEDDLRSWLVQPEDNERLSNLALAADLLFGAGALFAVGALVFAFFTDWGRGGETDAGAAGASRRFRISVAAGGDANAIGLAGAF